MSVRYTAFVLLRALPAWLNLSREKRREIAASVQSTVFDGPDVKVRYFDAEAFSARVSDVAMFEFSDMKAYYFMMEKLRDSPMLTFPYFHVEEIIPAIENGYQAFEAEQAA
jgi:hypothetical protein